MSRVRLRETRRDAYVWDSQGNLVAMSRRLGRTLVG